MPDTSPSKGFLAKIFGSKAKDIELPNESKKKDKRLKTKFDDIKEGYSIFKGLGKSEK